MQNLIGSVIDGTLYGATGAPKALWEKGRGDQHTPAGRIDACRCYACGGFDVTSSNPRPGPLDYVPSRRVDTRPKD